ncbi:TetR/AcrR family transcriptional regulator [Limoniibacter endophyticus]|uniref:TetR family transcriptional regulator n=1 Tax=Limoniibacter endophyticus TaxID=1565040 RepID=A0A8J3DL67_9HYPH|nr:TetR/AcrR family transcriptional regulator [Limoniibacter endophyticus]GHC66774.1 TetR family transcriptional regulator [Limoniibacter endophyticus]
MTSDRVSTRDRILDAATAIAHENGTANVSLNAVAERAGISKSGLLYHFSSKARLMEALVEGHVCVLKSEVLKAAEENRGVQNACIKAFVEAYRRERCAGKVVPTGVLAAIAENPDMITPIRRYQMELVETFKTQNNEPELALIAFLAIEGLRCMRLFDTQLLNGDEEARVIDKLFEILDQFKA